MGDGLPRCAGRGAAVGVASRRRNVVGGPYTSRRRHRRRRSGSGQLGGCWSSTCSILDVHVQRVGRDQRIADVVSVDSDRVLTVRDAGRIPGNRERR